MGYYHTIIEDNFRIPAEGFAPICKHLLDSGFTNPTEAVASGKTFSGGHTQEVFYAWTSTEKLKKCAEENDLIGIFTEFGFEVQTDDHGGIHGLAYDNKSGDEDQLFRCIAPFMDDFQFVSYRGEDGMLYRYYFVNQEMKICEGKIVFRMK
jgi:hypothetical protein